MQADQPQACSGAFRGKTIRGMKGTKGKSHTFEAVTFHIGKNQPSSPKKQMPSGEVLISKITIDGKAESDFTHQVYRTEQQVH